MHTPPSDGCTRRGMTPRMVELNRRLSDFEFKELAAAGARGAGAAIREEEGEEEEDGEGEGEEEGGRIKSKSNGSGLRLRSRLRVAASEPARLDGLELVEPAKVDPLYREDSETSAYLQRRRRQSSQVDSASSAAVVMGGDGGGVLSAERRRLVGLTRRIHSDWEEVSASMRELRALVAANGGLPLVGGGADDRRLRSTLWLAMLEVRGVAPDGYAQALRRCPSPSADKINNDAFRTLAADAEFRAHVATASIVRVLNALLSAPDRSASDPPRYVQGMNTLAAPFLYVMGEGASFYAFRQFLRRECPLYARPSLPGVHACVQLVDECLALADPGLFSHLRRHGAVAKIYAFPAAMTLSASVGPLREVVRLWDFLLAFGVHLNVVCIVAQLVAMREVLVTTPTPMAFLRAWPPLRAAAVIRRTGEIYESLPESLRRRIKMHAHDPRLAESLASAKQVPDPVGGPVASLKRDLPLSPSPRLRTGDASSHVPSGYYGALGLGLRCPPEAAAASRGGRQRGMRMAAAMGGGEAAAAALRLLPTSEFHSSSK
ncbi:CDC16 protein [Coemansia sp. RSA 2424]|nr:CDC16 protein [Coemansia sp. RSA 2424]